MEKKVSTWKKKKNDWKGYVSKEYLLFLTVEEGRATKLYNTANTD